MVCGARSSVSVKSFALRFSTGLPFLSFTETVSITNWLLLWKVGVAVEGDGAFCPTCCAGAARTIEIKRAIDRINQNLRRRLVCTLRMALAGFGNPNCVLVTVVFQLGNVTWLSAFVASTRKSRLSRSLIWKILPREAFRPNCDGPMMEVLPALPHWPDCGAAQAAG